MLYSDIPGEGKGPGTDWSAPKMVPSGACQVFTGFPYGNGSSFP